MTKYYVTIIQHTSIKPFRIHVYNMHITASSPLQAAQVVGNSVRSGPIAGLNGHTVHWFSNIDGRIISVEESLLS